MFASMVRRAPQRFARAVAIFGGEYLEIEQSIGEWNREIDQIIEKVHREFPIETFKPGLSRVLHAGRRFPPSHDLGYGYEHESVDVADFRGLKPRSFGVAIIGTDKSVPFQSSARM